MKNNVPLVAVICLMACFFRMLCEGISSGNNEFIALVMAFINAFALFFVLYLFIHNAFEGIKKEIESCKVESEKKNKVIRTVRFCTNLLIFILFGIAGGFYMKVHSVMSNDVLSIIALGMSIICNDLSDSLARAGAKIIKEKILIN